MRFRPSLICRSHQQDPVHRCVKRTQLPKVVDLTRKRGGINLAASTSSAREMPLMLMPSISKIGDVALNGYMLFTARQDGIGQLFVCTNIGFSPRQRRYSCIEKYPGLGLPATHSFHRSWRFLRCF